MSGAAPRAGRGGPRLPGWCHMKIFFFVLKKYFPPLGPRVHGGRGAGAAGQAAARRDAAADDSAAAGDSYLVPGVRQQPWEQANNFPHN